jgi:ferredoxin-NADP reductase
VSAVPTADRLRITIRATGDGTRALTALRPGAHVVVEGPYGIMNAARRDRRDVLLIAAGVGVTTMRGLAESVLREPASMGPGGFRRPSVVLLRRLHSQADALFDQEFAQLAGRGNLRVHGLVGRRSAASGWWGGARPVDPSAELRRLVPDLRDREVYLCGNPAWMTQVQQTLQALGVSRSAIHAEEFSW